MGFGGGGGAGPLPGSDDCMKLELADEGVRPGLGGTGGTDGDILGICGGGKGLVICSFLEIAGGSREKISCNIRTRSDRFDLYMSSQQLANM